MDENQFNEIRDELSGMDPLAKKVRLTDIRLEDNSIQHGVIFLHGNWIPVSPAFFNRLGQIVGINVALLNRMQKNNDREAQIKLLEAVKLYTETRDGGTTEYVLIGDPERHQIIDIVKASNYNRLANGTVFEIAQMLLNEIPGLSVQSIDCQGTGMNINLIHAKDKVFEKFGPDEVFRFGVTLANTDKTTAIKDFAQRLSCDNGMITKLPDNDGPGPLIPRGPAGMGGGGGTVSPDTFRDIINQAHIWSERGFIPVSFEDKLERATKTRASYGEMLGAFNQVEWQIREEDPDRRSWLVKALKAKHFPMIEDVEKRIVTKGYNPNQLTNEEKKFIRTGRSIWDLVNDLTFIGSHDVGFNMANNRKFKVTAGGLFVKDWDLANVSMIEI